MEIQNPGLLSRTPARKKAIPLQRIVLLLSVGLALAAWAFGFFSQGTDAAPFVPEVLGDAARVEIRGSLFVGYDPSGTVVGYAATGQSQGYGGPLELLVGIGMDGEITGVKIIEQRETPGFFKLLLDKDFFGQYPGRNYREPFQLNHDLDAVSGATVSAEGVAASARQAIRVIAAEGFSAPLPAEKRSVQFGFPELVLIGLYAAGYFGHKLRSNAWKRRIRWGTLLSGMLILGFIYTAPLTIAQVIALMSGYWPDWHSSLYWYILIGGILFVTMVDAKNPYCSWFCPFGAFQECLAQVTKAKLYRPRQWASFFTWLQRGLAFTAVIIGLALRRPGVAGYEPFATLFDFRGRALEVAFLLIIVLASLVMYRPFCNYLCPLDPVYDFIAEVRRWAREGWQGWKKKKLAE
jgi:NosR/NirI family transcriptional regulator, nitrous oxide reductase regulator